MGKSENRRRLRIGEIKKASCCGAVGAAAADGQCCPAPAQRPVEPNDLSIRKVSAEWSLKERIEHFRCRVGGLRMRYLTAPGLYAVGEPDGKSDVFVSANYKLSFDILRRALKGLNAWILVLDTRGINVWCAAGKGTFGTDELVKRIFEARLYERVEHRRIIVPQLGAPGIAAHVVQKQTGFRVHYGPVEASDIRAYVGAGYKAAGDMRLKRFPVADRLALVPMELIPAMKYYAVYALLVLIISGAGSSGVSFTNAWSKGVPLLFLGFAAVAAGTVITPLALPWLPFRSFAVKGWFAGAAVTLVALMGGLAARTGAVFVAFSCILFPLAASYVALQFTGASTYTGMTGVRKEMKYAMPVYIAGAVVSIALLAAIKLAELGLNPLRGFI